MRLDPAVNDLAATQWSLIATWQLRDLGADGREVARFTRRDDWTLVTKRVLRRTGVAPCRERDIMAAVLDAGPGAIACYGSGIWVWLGDRWFFDGAIDVTRRRGRSRRPSPLATVHEVVDLRPSHVKVVRGIPVASPARLVCEVAGTEHPARVERLLDTFWSDGLLDGRTFDRTVGELAGRGRKGSATLKELNAARGPHYVPPATGLERRFEEVLARVGEAPMRRQVDTGDETEWCGRVDFRDEVLPLVAEVQSERHHASLVDRAADDDRKARLRRAGFTVVEVWDTEVWHQPRLVVERIRDARRALRRRATAA